jgi:hypothetical protein
MTKKNESYIPSRHRVLRSEAAYIRNLLKGLGEADVRLYNHILQSNIQQRHDHPEGSPVPWATMKEYLPGAVSARLRPFVDISGYWPGHCRVYRVHDEHLIEYTRISSQMSAEEYLSEPHVCFETGRLMNIPPRSRLTSDANHPYPPTVRSSIRVLDRNGCYANLPAIEGHVRRRSADFESVSTHYDRGSQEFQKAQGRYINDSYCHNAFWKYKPVQHSGDIWFYRPAWQVAKTGRLHVKGGCLQSASGDMKRLAYMGIDGFRNYDVRSSQIFITVVLLEQASIHCPWLMDYYSLHDYGSYGRQIGIPGKLFKRIIIAMCMGAHLPSPSEVRYCSNNSILKYLGEVAQDRAHLIVLLKRLREVVGPLNVALRRWHSHLLTNYIQTHRVGGYLPNALGMYFSLKEFDLAQKRKKRAIIREVVAHILQGLEGACIQEMIARSDEANFTPISCEHDGFITSSGEADLTMWDEITERHGLGGMRLEEKEL